MKISLINGVSGEAVNLLIFVISPCEVCGTDTGGYKPYNAISC